MLRKRIRELDIPLWARNRALHYLANERQSDELRYRLGQVVEGYTGGCDEEGGAGWHGVDAGTIPGDGEDAAILIGEA
jgi:hypothetical protein